MAAVRPVLLAWSGGKDSAMTLAALRADPAMRVIGLLTTVTPAYDRISIHGVRRSILHAQADAVGLPVFEAELAPASSNEDYESAWRAVYARAQSQAGDVRAVAFGDLFLEDVRRYREDLATRAGYEPLFPLWGRDTPSLAEQFIADGYEAYLSCVDTTQLDAGFAGRRFDAALLRDLPPTVDPCGERGEFHTCVVGGPGFRWAIPIERGARVRRDDRFEFCDFVQRTAAAPSQANGARLSSSGA